MQSLDWVVLALLLASMGLGAWRGLVYELFSLVGWVAGFFVARLVAPDVAAWLPVGDLDANVRYGLGFVLTFILAVFVWGLVSSLAKKLVELAGLRPVDRTLGAFFGLLRASVLVLVASVVVVATPLQTATWWTDSVAAPWLTDAVARILPALPSELGRYLPS